MLIARTARQVAHHRFETLPRRGVIGFALLHRIEDTDRIVGRHPVTVLAGGALVFFGLIFVVMSVLEKVLG